MRSIIQHHKKLSLELVPDVLGEEPFGGAGATLVPPHVQPPRLSSRQGLRATSRRRSSSTEALDAMERQERRAGSDPAETLTAALRVGGREARVSLSATGLEWTYEGGGCLSPPSSSETLPFGEMLSVQQLEAARSGLGCWPAPRCHRLAVFTFRRSGRRRADWAPRRLVLETPSQDAARDWAAAIGAGIAATAGGRPSTLLVVLNPNAGYRRSRVVYKRIVEPVFAAAGIKATVVETQWPGHGAAMVQQMPLGELLSYDGLVGVGGDGVFHELMNGLLAVRAAQAGAAGGPPEGLLRLRLAHIPAGSTDAVACTFHGTRSVFTAAMHIALGDRTELDVLRLDTPSGTTIFSSCMASYGFMGDVMADSEAYRFMGPVRYDLVGTLKLLACRAYPARVSYLKGSYMAAALSAHRQQMCGANCKVCRTASRAALARRLTDRSASQLAGGASEGGAPPRPPSSASSESGEGSEDARRARSPPPGAAVPASVASSPGAAEFLHPTSTAPQRHEEDWVEIEGEFVSIMMLNMPCISEKTRSGIVRFCHLADGTIKLVLVRKCSPLRYLRFLMDMSSAGLHPGQHSYVEVIDAVAVRVECPAGQPQSRWNLDGELLRSSTITAEIHQGLLNVFARGVER
eukprot:scaffold3.g6239.t1